MSAAEKYLIRKPAPQPDAPRLSERAALLTLVAETGGAACSFHEVGPVAAHLVGPVAAYPPQGHPEYEALTGHRSRIPDAVNRLIVEACGLRDENAVRCSCDDRSYHRLTVTRRQISQGKVALAHQNSAETQRRVDNAIASGDVDLLLHSVCPRAWALSVLVDRARAEHGGALPDHVAEAAVVLARTLAGPTRWNVRDGYTSYPWPPEARVGAAFEKCDSFMKNDYVFDILVIRLLDGR